MRKEKQMKKNSIIGDTLVLSLSNVITMAINMISAMFLSRFRSLSEYGTYSQIILVINLATALFLLGIPSSVNFFLAKADTQKKKKEFLSNYYTVTISISIALGAILAICAPLIARYFDNSTLTKYTYFLLLFPLSQILTSGIGNILIVSKKATQLTVYNICQSVASLGLIFIIKIFEGDFDTYITAYLVMQLTFAIFVQFWIRRIAGGLSFAINKELLKSIFTFSIPIGLAGVVGTLGVELGKLIIGWFFDTEQLAIYTNASKELPVTMIATSLTAVLMPRLVRLLNGNMPSVAISLWKESTSLAFILISHIVMLLYVFAPQFISFLYSEKYLPGTDIFRIYSLVLLLRVTYFGMVLNALGRTKFILYSSLVSLIINAVLAYLFFLAFGIIGPAIAAFVSTVTINLVQLIFTSKHTKIPFRNIFPWKSLILFLFINAFIGASYYFIFNNIIELSSNQIVRVFIFCGISMTLYIILCLRIIKRKVRIINDADKRSSVSDAKI